MRHGDVLDRGPSPESQQQVPVKKGVRVGGEEHSLCTVSSLFWRKSCRWGGSNYIPYACFLSEGIVMEPLLCPCRSSTCLAGQSVSMMVSILRSRAVGPLRMVSTDSALRSLRSAQQFPDLRYTRPMLMPISKRPVIISPPQTGQPARHTILHRSSPSCIQPRPVWAGGLLRPKFVDFVEKSAHQIHVLVSKFRRGSIEGCSREDMSG